MPVERQVLIVLKRCGAHENGMSLHDVAEYAKIRHDMIDFITQRIIITILDTNLRTCYIH